MKISNDKIKFTKDTRTLREKNLHSNIPCDCSLRDKKLVQKIAIRNQWIYVESHIELGHMELIHDSTPSPVSNRQKSKNSSNDIARFDV